VTVLLVMRCAVLCCMSKQYVHTHRTATAVQRYLVNMATVIYPSLMNDCSGLPDFRGNEGFWNHYPPMRKLGLSFSDMANPRWFESDPKIAWGFYGHRLNLYRNTTPHYGFQLMRNWTQSKKDPSFVFTSNVDNQFQKAGFDEDRIVECHGSVWHLQCVQSCCDDIVSSASLNVTVDEDTFQAEEPLPRCPKECDNLARPNVLMFGDPYWIDKRTREQQRRMFKWQNDMKRKRLVIIELGAGTAVPTVRATSESMLTSNPQNRLIRINPRESFFGTYSSSDTRYLSKSKQHLQFIPLPLGSLQALSAIQRIMDEQAQYPSPSS
jgi:NAD-dependent SIR2 family protein deacetylase